VSSSVEFQLLQQEETSNEQRNLMIKPLGQRPVGRHMGSLDEEKKEGMKERRKTGRGGGRKREKVLN